VSARRTHGFTLIEVLVALALIAVVLGGSFGVVRESIANQGHLGNAFRARFGTSPGRARRDPRAIQP